jgi:N-sulfoglucosamine sulfohydrolase
MTSGGRPATRAAIGRRPIAENTARDVVLMTTHDIGRHLGCYGAKGVTSPNLDALAAAGAMFTNAFCTAPQCSPSRASLATGRYPHNNGVMGLAHHGFDWELEVPHSAAVFGGAGFQTHLFGGQHVTLHPDRLGFTRIHRRPTDELIEELLRTDSRLYIEINFDETHRPYPAAPTAADVVVPVFLPDTPEARSELSALNAAVAQMDAAAGRVLDALAKAERAENAIVVFTTDHGLAMPRAKCTLYDPGLEVALIVRWPGGNLSGSRQELVSNIDVLPTLLEAAGIEVPDEMQGRSLLRGQERDAVFGEKTFHSYYDPMRCVRTRRHKYIVNFETAFRVEVPGDIQAGAIFRADPTPYSTDRSNVVELYDLEADPLERENLAGHKDVREIEAELRERLWTWMRETDDPLLKGPISSPRYRLAMRPED